MQIVPIRISSVYNKTLHPVYNPWLDLQQLDNGTDENDNDVTG